ncbi:hypothetical protein SCHPADRAFT_278584 [Schizopora paradoxa]|uniref:Protein-lysine N-methyltransferase EFM6 n=1 Tax=Schizopora paradoxa TaxID=27342 RepID=A0A0H2S0C2_9AGAM|nr:hypothetical protein SCHPADRAFT_278584 [Schizopora paradoxa]
MSSLSDSDDVEYNGSETLDPFQKVNVVEENTRREPISIELTYPLGADPTTGNITVRLQTDPSPGCGGIAWPAGEVLAKYLAGKGPDNLNGKAIVELGSGTGLVGLVAALLGARVYITDQLPLLPAMEKNTDLNGLQNRVNVVEYNWGGDIPDGLPDRIDYVLAADCVYFEPAFPLLVKTLCDLNGRGQPEFFFCYKKRRKADKRFFAQLKKYFTWQQVGDDPDFQVYSRDSISLFRLVFKGKGGV